MSPAAGSDSPPGHGSGPSGAAELLCALSYGSGLAVAERMEHGTNTAFVGVHLGRALGLAPEGLEAVFYGALLKDVGCGACSAVLAPFFPDEELAPRLDLILVDMHSPRSMLAWGKIADAAGSHPAHPARPPSRFASQCGSVTHEAMAAHCEIAADFAARLGFGAHVQDAVHYQWERYDGRGRPSTGAAEAIPRPAQILHLALAADLARSLAGADGAATMVRQRAGTYFDPDVAEAYLDLADGLWPPGDDPIPLADVLACDPGTPVDALPGDRRLAGVRGAGRLRRPEVRPARPPLTVRGSPGRPGRRLPRASAKPNRTGSAGPALVHDLGKIAVPYRLLREGRRRHRARRSAQAGALRSLSRSACTPTTPSASCPGSAPSPTWPQTSAPTTSGSTARATRSG